ncbi:MAG: hypothetical protein WC455_19805 [Dehalococcoidia bacterium]|jgi:hypothetical protein
MPEPNPTLNTADAIAASSTAADKPVFDPGASNLVNTVDGPNKMVDAPAATTDKSIKPEDAEAKAKADADAQAKADQEKADQEGRFDKHPRFQELISRTKTLEESLQTEREARIRAEAERDVVQKASTKVEKPKELPFKDTSEMTGEEIAEWLATDPKGYNANLRAEAKYIAQQELKRELEIRDQTLSKTQRDNKIKADYEQYEKDHPDFIEMWNSGKILAYVEAHPGYSPIAAHMALTREAREKTIRDEALKDANQKLKDAEEKAKKDAEAKRKASSVLGGGPAARPGEPVDAELQNTKERGGPVTVLFERLKKMRAAR